MKKTSTSKRRIKHEMCWDCDALIDVHRLDGAHCSACDEPWPCATARKQIQRRESKRWVKIEIRAAFLALDAPRGRPWDFPKEVLDPCGLYSYDEFVGWSKHYWYQYSRSKENRNAAPENADELAGWLAREIFLTDD